MTDLNLFLRILDKSAKRLPIVCAAALPLGLIGCNQSRLNYLNLKDIEQNVGSFYKSKSLTENLRVKEVAKGIRVEGFCILSAYEERVTPTSDKVIAVNAFLEKNKLLGREDYWHLIVKTPEELRVARFDAAQIPLISPRPAYGGGNCVLTRSIIFSKMLVQTGGAPLVGGSRNMKVVIDIQPGD